MRQPPLASYFTLLLSHDILQTLSYAPDFDLLASSDTFRRRAFLLSAATPATADISFI